MATDAPAIEETGLRDDADAVVTVRVPPEMMTRQRLPYFVGISRDTAGSGSLAMNLVVIPPAGAAEPHVHRGYETAIYVLRGRVETRFGRRLRHSVTNEARLRLHPGRRAAPAAEPERRGAGHGHRRPQ